MTTVTNNKKIYLSFGWCFALRALSNLTNTKKISFSLLTKCVGSKCVFSDFFTHLTSKVDKPWSEWTHEERRRAQYDCNAKNIITSSLSMDDFFRVSQCKNAKEMWDVLEVTHEGTNEVKRARKHALIQEYELFKMQKGESIVEVQKRFTHIVNHLMV
ncbi:uncharacterized protein LOC114166485 isoform X2 [Vigna unguiculata]|uniref:uncharacterized protein LOC114166485 isoform X2 n=1 Tax=Vigna unguiculata TaxID=3917 RepID=UPI0010165094|nr:uncharacterized protein LOC114166485 isoform X2 [Vigna unguiculata]